MLKILGHLCLILVQMQIASYNIKIKSLAYCCYDFKVVHIKTMHLTAHWLTF